MAATIGSLRAVLSLNSAQFEAGIKRARQTMARMAMDLRAAAQVAGAAGAALGALGATAVASARDIQRLSQVANTTPDVLQRWSAATRTVGIDQEKLADILKDVNDRIGDFVETGGGPMADFFENIAPRVGVTAEMFERLSGPEALQLFVSSLERAGLSQQQMTFYMEAMASDATLLLPLLRNNAAELERLGTAAEQAGAVVSNEAVAALNRMGETADRIRDSFVGMRGEVAGALAPSFERLAASLQKAMGEGGILRRIMMTLAEQAERLSSYALAAAAAFGAYASAVVVATAVTMGFRRALIRTGIGAVIVGLGEAVYQFSRLREATGSAVVAFTMFGDLAKGVINAMVEQVVWFGNRYVGIYRGAFNAVREIWNAFPAVFGSIITTTLNSGISLFESFTTQINRGFNELIEIANWLIDFLPERFGDRLRIPLVPDADFGRLNNPWAEEARDAGRAAANAFVEGFNTDTIAAPRIFDVRNVRDQWNRIQDIISRSEGAREATEALEDLRGALEDVATMPEAEAGGQTPADAVDELSDAAKRAQSAMGTVRDGLAEVFSTAIRGAGSAREAVGRLLDRLADMAAQNAFKALFNNTFGNGLSGGNPTPFGNILGFLFGGGVDAFANGGRSMGGLAMVGERGPELVNLPRGSYVSTAAETARMLDGAGGPQEVHVFVHPSGEFDTRVQGAAARVVEAGIREYDRSGVSRRIAAYQADPRARR